MVVGETGGFGASGGRGCSHPPAGVGGDMGVGGLREKIPIFGILAYIFFSFNSNTKKNPEEL